MNINNNFNVLPWYYSVDQQNANKWYAYGNIWPLVSSNAQLLPFQLVIDKPITTISTIKVHKLSDSSSVDSGLKPIILPASGASYTIVSLITNTLPSTLTEGRYYCSMNIDGTDIYSEVFTVVSDLSKYIKVTYWNEDNLAYKGGAIDYSNGFKYYMYICSDIAKPEYPFEEELTKRAGYKFLESQISSKLYKFTFIAPEFICDAMRLIRLNDYIQVESRGQKYNALNFTYNPKWEEQGDLASVECEFETDNIIQKLESFNRRQQESFYNALLANANDPILFDAGVVAQYYKDSQATGLVEGKLIRELDETLIVDAPSYIPVDNGIGAAKRLDLKAILAKYAIKTEVYESLATKWTYDAARAASWDEASKDRHTHTNKPALDLIAYDAAKKTWQFTGNIALSGVVSMYADLGDLDIPNIYAGLPIDNRTIKRDINGMLFAESTTGGSFDETAMWTALGTNISTKLIATKYLNLAGYATEAYVLEKIQGLGVVFNLKGTKPTPADLPTTDNKIGDVWYVASESVGYIWLTDENGVLRWEKFGEPVDLSAYYTKTEVDTRLATKWTTDQALITNWNDAYSLRHSHSNKAILDGINNTLINNWNSASADAHKHANKPALDLIEYDSVKNVWKFTGNAAFSGDVISYANLGDLNIPSLYEGLPIDNVTIKRNSAGALYSLSGSGGDFDKAAMWSALALSTTEQINKSHLADALSTYVLTTDSRLSDSRNAKDVYAWAKQPSPPAVDLSNYVTTGTPQTIQGQKTFTSPLFLNNSVIGDSANSISLYTKEFGGQGLNVRSLLVSADYSYRQYVPDQGAYFVGDVKANSFAKHGGTANQFLKANGSIDSNAYVTINHNHTYLLTEDYRDRNPLDFPNKTLTPFFLYGGKIGLTGYCDAMYLNTYSDTSGGKTNLLAVSKVNGEIYRMMVNQGANTWDGTLVKMLDSSNWTSVVDGRYLSLTGGSLSGNLTIGGIVLDYNNNYIRTDGWFQNNINGLGLYNSAADARWFANSDGWNSDKQIKILGNTVWNQGNDGAGSGLDADMLDGLHKSSYAQKVYGITDLHSIPVTDSYVTFFSANESAVNQANSYMVGFQVSNNNDPSYNKILAFGFDGRLYTKKQTGGIYDKFWQSVAYITDNVASATVLQTARSIWGQPFKGDSNIEGPMYGVRSINGLTNTPIDYVSQVGHYFYSYNNPTPIMSLTNGNVAVNGSLNTSGDIYSNGIIKTQVMQLKGQDFIINNKRALVGPNDALYINYLADFPKVILNGDLYATSNLLLTGFSSAQRYATGYDSGAAQSMSCANWFRSNGNTGWINDTYGGGIYMPDSSHIAVYGSKKFLISETSFDSFRTKGGIVAEGNTLQLGNIKLVVNPSAKTIRFEMLDGTPCNIVSTGDVIIYN